MTRLLGELERRAPRLGKWTLLLQVAQAAECRHDPYNPHSPSLTLRPSDMADAPNRGGSHMGFPIKFGDDRRLMQILVSESGDSARSWKTPVLLTFLRNTSTVVGTASAMHGDETWPSLSFFSPLEWPA
ncbi:MAG: hypothetical protein AAF989_02450 [Planctomycetota bacterium]